MSETFQEFPKIARLSRRCVITEKIDGTNAQVHVTEDGRILVGSRNGYIDPAIGDPFGFALWVREHETELRELGPGRHYGEWFGKKIQRAYGLDDRRFALFNTGRWSETRPACCHVVPVLFDGIFTTDAVFDALNLLRVEGSRAVPGFMRPEGVVVWHEASGALFKKTIERDEEWKGRKS